MPMMKIVMVKLRNMYGKLRIIIENEIMEFPKVFADKFTHFQWFVLKYSHIIKVGCKVPHTRHFSQTFANLVIRREKRIGNANNLQ